MKKIITLLTICFISKLTIAQSNLGVGTAAPDASAKLDITATDKGILVPRMTTTNRTAIATPAKGLMVYDSTIKAFYYHDGAAWNAVGGSTLPTQTGNSGKVLTTNGTTASWGSALPPTTQLPNAFMPHATTTSAQGYLSPFVFGLGTLNPAHQSCFLITNACTLNITFYSLDDEGITFELFEVTPVANANVYATTGAALATAATTGWVSGSPTTASFSYAAAAGKIYVIKSYKTGGSSFTTSGVFFTSFYAN